MKKKQNTNNPAEEAFKEGYGIVRANPILGPLLRRADAFFNDSYPMARDDRSEEHTSELQSQR